MSHNQFSKEKLKVIIYISMVNQILVPTWTIVSTNIKLYYTKEKNIYDV